MNNKDKIIYDWKYIDKKNRGILWYIIAISMVLGLSIWGILTKQYGLSFIVVLAAGVYFFIDNNSDDEVNIKITEDGIGINESFYNYGKITSFSIMYDNEIAVFLRLNINKKGIKKIDISINNEIGNISKTILQNFIEEKNDGELSFSDKLINFLKL